MFKYKGNYNYNINFSDSSSLPVNSVFIESVKNSGAKILNTSKWLNAVYVSASEEEIRSIQQSHFVHEIIYPAKIRISVSSTMPVKRKLDEQELLKKQIGLMQGERYINTAISGKGIKIGVLDVGFGGYRKTKELEHLITNGHIIEYKEFSDQGMELNFQRAHGTEVLSCLAGKTDSLNLGLATEADYYLATYHKVADMIEALEWFEEKGVKIINNSTKLDFGYYDKEDLNGEQVLASKALQRAADAGILIFTSMGNEGDTYWRSLVAPSDAKGVISIGSVSPETELRSEFSSLGPTFDRRIKPELCGVGEAIVANQVRRNRENGTSFATPLVAGFAACAWQLNPSLTKDQLYEHLLKSGSLYPYFDYAHGYGVPKANYFFDLKEKKDSVQKIQPTITMLEKNDTIFFYVNEKPLPQLSGPEFIPIRPSKGVYYNGKIIKREGKFLKKADAEDLDGKDYVFYHIADQNNQLKKYVVIKLENENIFYIPKKAMRPGYTLRVFYKGYLQETKF